MELATRKDLYIHKLKELYSAERQLIKAREETPTEKKLTVKLTAFATSSINIAAAEKNEVSRAGDAREQILEN